MKPIRYLVVGVGALGRHHARIAADLDGVELVAVADPNSAQGTRIADDLRTRWVSDFRSVLDSVDAASIVVPTTLHRRIAADFIDRGIPVLVEKPLAHNVHEGRALVAAAEGTGSILQVGHIERFNPAFQQLAARVTAPKYIRAERLSPYAFRSMDISAVHDLMIHDIDLVLTLAASPVVSVEAFGVCILGGHADAVQARLRFANGCIADLVANRVNPEFRRRMQVWSVEGCVTADLHKREVIHYRPSRRLLGGDLPHALALEPGANIPALKEAVFGEFIETETPPIEDCDQLTAEIGHFIECIRSGRTPRVDGRAGLAALEVAEQITDRVAAHAWNNDGAEPVGPHLLPVPPMSRAA